MQKKVESVDWTILVTNSGIHSRSLACLPTCSFNDWPWIELESVARGDGDVYMSRWNLLRFLCSAQPNLWLWFLFMDYVSPRLVLPCFALPAWLLHIIPSHTKAQRGHNHDTLDRSILNFCFAFSFSFVSNYYWLSSLLSSDKMLFVTSILLRSVRTMQTWNTT